MGYAWVEGDAGDKQGSCQRGCLLRELEHVSEDLREPAGSLGAQEGTYPLQQYSCSHDDLN